MTMLACAAGPHVPCTALSWLFRIWHPGTQAIASSTCSIQLSRLMSEMACAHLQPVHKGWHGVQAMSDITELIA